MANTDLAKVLSEKSIWPVNGYLLVKVEDIESGGIVKVGIATYAIGKVVKSSGVYIKEKGEKPRTDDPKIPEGARVLFPAIYILAPVKEHLYVWFPEEHLLLLKTDSVLLVEEEPGALDHVDLYSGWLDESELENKPAVIKPL